MIQINGGNQNTQERKNILIYSFFLKAGEDFRSCPHEPRQLITLINSLQLDNLVKRMGRSLRLSQTNGLCWAQLLSLRGRGRGCPRPCEKEGSDLFLQALLSPGLSSRIISFHTLAPWFSYSWPSLHSIPLLPDLPLWHTHYMPRTFQPWPNLLISSLTSLPWSLNTDSVNRPGTSPTHQLWGPHASKNQTAHPTTSCKQCLSIFPW